MTVHYTVFKSDCTVYCLGVSMYIIYCGIQYVHIPLEYTMYEFACIQVHKGYVWLCTIQCIRLMCVRYWERQYWLYSKQWFGLKCTILVRALLRRVCAIQKCVRYSEVHALFRNACAIQKCMRFSEVCALFRSVCAIKICVPHSELRALFRIACTNLKCVCYSEVLALFRSACAIYCFRYSEVLALFRSACAI